VARNVLTAFKHEGFRYLGRIRLARDLDLFGALGGKGGVAGANATDATGKAFWVPPPKDAEGNWLVDAVRCTVEGDMYAGRMRVDGNAPLTSVDAQRPVVVAAGTAAAAAAAQGQEQEPRRAPRRSGKQQGQGPAAASASVAEPSVEEAAEALELAAQQVQAQAKAAGLLSQKKGGGGGKEVAAAAGGSGSGSGSSSGNGSGSGSSSKEQQHESFLQGIAKMFESIKQAFAQGFAKGKAEGGKVASKATAAAPADAAKPAAASPAGRSLLGHEEEPSEIATARSAAALPTPTGRPARRLRATSSSSSSSSRSLQGIVGADERFPCTARKWPFSAIGQIEVLDDSGTYICTGTLIAPDKVITAGHCVWNSKRGAFYFNLSFSPGRYRTEEGRRVDPWGTIPWSSVTVFDQFKKDPTQWDVAVVTLAKPVGEQAGTMGLASGCARNARLWVSGYPQEKQEGTCLTATCVDPVLDCGAQLNAHTCDTTSGMSGAPMFDSRYRVRMLHVAGVEGKQENRATTVSDFLISTVMKW
jgi:V8-like Glu-specific endopeptidase